VKLTLIVFAFALLVGAAKPERSYTGPHGMELWSRTEFLGVRMDPDDEDAWFTRAAREANIRGHAVEVRQHGRIITVLHPKRRD
jgi:hypothetical protein